MQRGFFGFEHSHLSRAGSKTRGKSGPLHLSAVASYMSNANKVASVQAVNLPTDRGQLYRELNKHTATVKRKNGRIGETFTINFDARMAPEHMDEALGRFIMAATFQGKTRAEGWRHGDHPHNPHAHVILIDVDGNGEPVAHFGRSGTYRRENSPVKGNPTVWLRQLWQDECNAVLEAHGYEFRIDRRSKLEQTLEKQAKQREARAELEPVIAPEVEEESQADHLGDVTEMVEPAPECPLMPVEAEEPGDYGDELEEAPEAPEDDNSDEDDMADSLPARDRVGFATDLYNQLALLRHTQSRLEYINGQIAASVARLKEAEDAAPQYTAAMHRAEMQKAATLERLKTYQREDGKLKGFDLSIKTFNLTLWKSKTRQLGEAAALRYAAVESEFENAERDYKAAQGQVAHYKSMVESQTEQKVQTQQDLDRMEKSMGNARDLDEAAEILTASMAQALSGIDAEQLTQMVQDGEISEGEYTDALKMLNTPSAQLALAEYQRDRGGLSH